MTSDKGAAGGAAGGDRPAVKNADVPGHDPALPDVGDEASATHYMRDTFEDEDVPKDKEAPQAPGE